MPEIVFEVDPELLPAATDAFMVVAATMYLELAKERRGRDLAWVSELKQRLRYQAATFEAPPGADAELAEKWPATAIAAVDHVFDYVLFQPKDDAS